MLLVFFVATGSGHGHGNSLVGAFFFGPAAVFWFVLTPAQYALYAYVAYRGYRRIGLLLALIHYVCAVDVILFRFRGQSLLDGLGSLHWQSWIPEQLLTYGPFFVLNALYFWHLLKVREINRTK